MFSDASQLVDKTRSLMVYKAFLKGLLLEMVSQNCIGLLEIKKSSFPEFLFIVR